MRTLRDPSGWKKNLPLYYSDFEEKKPKHLHPFFFFPRRFLSLNAPIFITISITFSHISRYVMERNVMEGKGRSSSTPLDEPVQLFRLKGRLITIYLDQVFIASP